MLLVSFSASTQNKNTNYKDPIDSFNTVLNTDLLDSNKIKVLRAYANEVWDYHPDTALILFKEALLLSKKLSYEIGEGRCLFDIGSIYYETGIYNLSAEYFLSALAVYRKIKDSVRISKTLNNLGIVSKQVGDYQNAFDYHIQSLQISEKVKDTVTTLNIWNNMGLLFLEQNNYDKAEYYFSKCVKLNTLRNNKKGLAVNYNNLALVLEHKGNIVKALDYHEKVLMIEKELNNKLGIVSSTGNIGNIYYKKKDFKTALNFFKDGLANSYQLNDDYIMSQFYGNIGRTYYDLLDFKNAAIYNDSSFKLAMQMNYKNLIVTSSLTFADIYSKSGNFQKAFYFQRLYSEFKDSLINQENSKAFAEMETKYETEKKEKEIELLNKEKEKQAAISKEQNKRKNIIIFSSIGGLLIVTIFSIFLFNRFNVTRKQKQIIEEKQKEITDSINFAKRIQTAILPPENYWKTHLPESFVMYQPKDIVSGDFYWLENMNDFILFAAADCTGHGVSGAMVSVVCSNALTRTVKEFGITEPEKILNKVRELVLETFAKSENDIKDGMDISLCCLNTRNNELLWSGANNPLWYIRENNLNEIKGDKQPIGKNDNPKPFTSHSVQLQKQDTIYILTDGYPDQFGGEKNKKFKYKPLKDLLAEIHQKPLEIQEEILEQHFTSWKGNTEQTDDVLIIGVKV